MNSFMGLNVAVRGLFASQTAIYTIDHNVSNADTTGYSRQVITQKASTALKMSNGSGMLGTGVDVTSVKRIRDEFLDQRYWHESSYYGEWNTKCNYLSEMEAMMNETSENGLNSVLSSFSAALEDLADDPSSGQARAVAVKTGDALCKYVNNEATDLSNLRKDYNNAVKIKVNEINSYARQIRDLNEQIYKAELDGSTANDLRDQRALLLDKLSVIADVKASEVDAGTLPNGKKDVRFQVTLDGVSLVNHFQANELECYTIADGSDKNGMYGMRWAKTGMEVEFTGGEIKGILDIRDGSGQSGDYKGIPYYLNQLDTFARSFAKAFNEGIYADGVQYCAGHAGGVGSDGSTGIRFFSYDGMSSAELMSSAAGTDAVYMGITAANLCISTDVANDTDKVAAASASGEAENNENVSALVNIFNDNRVFDEGMPEDFVNSIISTMGVETGHAARLSANQESIVSHIDSSRTSVSGVSLDEETANLVKYQQAYNAAAKMISVLDEILDMTINGLGAG